MSSPPKAGGTLSGVADIEVSEETVLAVRAALLAEAERLRIGLLSLMRDLRVEPMGGDPVSRQAAPAWTGRLVGDEDSYWQRCWAYMESLHEAGEALTEVARTYGYTEEEIMRGFTLGEAGVDV